MKLSLNRPTSYMRKVFDYADDEYCGVQHNYWSVDRSIDFVSFHVIVVTVDQCKINHQKNGKSEKR